jgi:hypothetical protein
MQNTLAVLIATSLAAAVLGSPPPAQAAGASTGGNPPNCIAFGVICKANRVVFLFDPEAKFFNLQPCTCGTTKLTVCNPDITSGGTTTATGAAATVPACVGDAALTEVPTQVEAVKNPGTFFCTTIGGRRTCYDRRP